MSTFSFSLYQEAYGKNKKSFSEKKIFGVSEFFLESMRSHTHTQRNEGAYKRGESLIVYSKQRIRFLLVALQNLWTFLY